MPDAGWYPDPWKAAPLRWWDGAQWTGHVHEPAPAVPAVVPVSRRAWVAPAVRQGISTVRSTPRPARRRQTNPTLVDLLGQLQPHPESMELDEQIEVAGETFHVKGIKGVYRVANKLITDHGTTIETVACALLPEPWNPHDANAVAVMIGPHHVGYLPAEDAVDYGPVLGRIASRGHLVMGTARVWAKSNSGVIRARVTVLVPEVDVLVDLR